MSTPRSVLVARLEQICQDYAPSPGGIDTTATNDGAVPEVYEMSRLIESLIRLIANVALLGHQMWQEDGTRD
jgi:hypothetical protein